MSKLARVVKGGLRRRGIELVRTSTSPLELARRAGIRPTTVIDVGAAHGSWSLSCAATFPEARYLLIEPLREHRSHLDAVAGRINDAQIIEAVATAFGGQATINVHEDLVGSSLLSEDEPDVNGTPRSVEAITVDSLGVAGPCILKVDVQGAELDVLVGATATLRHVELAVLETSMFRFFRGGPLFHDVVMWMAKRGFVVYDFGESLRRPLDDALSQIDVVFVPEISTLRESHIYARPDQRAAQNAQIRRESGAA